MGLLRDTVGNERIGGGFASQEPRRVTVQQTARSVGSADDWSAYQGMIRAGTGQGGNIGLGRAEIDERPLKRVTYRQLHRGINGSASGERVILVTANRVSDCDNSAF